MTRRVHERVTRPDGREWVFSPKPGRSVRREATEAGPALVVGRTHDLELARGLVAERWAETHPDAPVPEGRRAWRRPHLDAFSGRRTPHMVPAVAVGDEGTSYPVVIFDPPALVEQAA